MILGHAGSGVNKIGKCNIYLADMDNFDRMNVVYVKVCLIGDRARLVGKRRADFCSGSRIRMSQRLLGLASLLLGYLTVHHSR